MSQAAETTSTLSQSASVPLSKQTWPAGTLPAVSICCTTYNHEKYIRECVESFLMQETTFPVEIIVCDDASTDSTTSIVREYERSYPGLFRPIYHQDNMFSKGFRPMVDFVLPRVRGRYIAMCEGDDYWTDSVKLQEQYEFLESRPDYVMCHHNTLKIFEGSDRPPVLYKHEPKERYDLRDYLDIPYFQSREGLLPGHTSSRFIRTSAVPTSFPPWLYASISGDICLCALIAKNGPSGFIKKTMSVRRKNPGGVTYRHKGLVVFENRIRMISAMKRHFGRKYENLLGRQIRRYWVKWVKEIRANQGKAGVALQVFGVLQWRLALSDKAALLSVVFDLALGRRGDESK